ncbi:MAG: geranylgeranyl diphosphate reductase [Anaerolineae bacterium]|jgi:geranylgeranyl reductase|nr:geranylgeranyl diphosphate reductase [Anaerolineae bacterium]
MKPVLVVGASVGGSVAASTLAKAGVPVILLERDLAWVKPCGGALPPIAFKEFDIPESLISRKVRRAIIHSPTERLAEIEVTGLKKGRDEYVAMTCREELDPYLRLQAVRQGAELIEGKLTDLKVHRTGVTAKYVPKNSRETQTLEVEAVIGADGAYSTTAKLLGLPRPPYCVAIQHRIRLPQEKMARWQETADLYLGQKVSPDLYAWAFPKSDHLAVGCGAGPGKAHEIRQMLHNLKERIAPDIAGGEVFLEEAHALPIHPRDHIAFERVMLVGDAAGLVVGTSGEGIYWAMKSARRAAETLIKALPDTSLKALQRYEKSWWQEYRMMYRFLQWLQRWGYGSERQMEVFTDMCRNQDVQRLTFESYMYKQMTPVPWVAQMRMTADILAAQARHFMSAGV